MRLAVSLLLLVPFLATPALAEFTPCGDYLTYANGQTLRDGNSYYYPNGQPVLSGHDTIYYPSGAVFQSGDSTYYPDGHLLQDGVDDLYYPNGVDMRHWNGNSYDYNYDDGKPLVRGEQIFLRDGTPAPATGKTIVPIGTYGTIETSDIGFVSTSVYLGNLIPGSGGVIIPAGQTAGLNDLAAIVQWPDMNYRPYYIVLLPTGNGTQKAWIDRSGSWTTCNLTAK